MTVVVIVGGTHKASLLPHKQTLCRVHLPGCRPESGNLLTEGEEADTCPEREAFLSLLSTCSVHACGAPARRANSPAVSVTPGHQEMYRTAQNEWEKYPRATKRQHSVLEQRGGKGPEKNPLLTHMQQTKQN